MSETHTTAPAMLREPAEVWYAAELAALAAADVTPKPPNEPAVGFLEAVNPA